MSLHYVLGLSYGSPRNVWNIMWDIPSFIFLAILSVIFKKKKKKKL